MMEMWREGAQALTQWYGAVKRDLPWRRDMDPYKIWISEIMLQQTRVETVKPYYERLTERLPRVKDLAELPLEELYKLWEGLGYYSRARHLQAAAQQMMERYDGKVPETKEELLRLPGIGRYTAGAVASLAFHQPVAAVDGNVCRIISRLTLDEEPVTTEKYKKKTEAMLEAFLAEGIVDAGEFNAALMELGETLCVPGPHPACEACPLRPWCRAEQTGRQGELPVREKPKPRRVERLAVYLLTDGERFGLEKRPSQGLLAGLYQFPNEPMETAELPVGAREVKRYRHVFSHVEWEMTAYVVPVSAEQLDAWCQGDRVAVTGRQIQQELPLPSAFQPFAEVTLS